MDAIRRRPPGKDGLRHRMRMPGIGICGVKERDGARFTTLIKLIDCPACVALIASRRAAAKQRAGVA